jgi:hypothetical protein
MDCHELGRYIEDFKLRSLKEELFNKYEKKLFMTSINYEINVEIPVLAKDSKDAEKIAKKKFNVKDFDDCCYLSISPRLFKVNNSDQISKLFYNDFPFFEGNDEDIVFIEHLEEAEEAINHFIEFEMDDPNQLYLDLRCQ